MGGVTLDGCGYPCCSLLCARATRSFGLVVCKSDVVAGIEIIPLEPDRCSDLRVAHLPFPLSSHFGAGQIQKSLMFFLSLLSLGTIRLQTGAV